MAEWIEPVFDRSQSDIDYAKQQLSMGINNVEYKGCFNTSDANRVENNTRYLADKLNEAYYFTDITTDTTWSKNSFFYKAHVERMISNVGSLLSAYFTPNGSAALPPTLLHYEHINAIEKNLYLIKEMLDDMIGSFRECGTFECGEE